MRASAFFSSLLFLANFFALGLYGYGTTFLGSKNYGTFGFSPLAFAALYCNMAFLCALFLAFYSDLYFLTAAFLATALAFFASFYCLALMINLSVALNGFYFLIRAALFLASALSFLIFF